MKHTQLDSTTHFFQPEQAPAGDSEIVPIKGLNSHSVVSRKTGEPGPFQHSMSLHFNKAELIRLFERNPQLDVPDGSLAVAIKKLLLGDI